MPLSTILISNSPYLKPPGIPYLSTFTIQLMTQSRNMETIVTFYFSLTRNITNFTFCIFFNSVSPLPLILVTSRLYCFNKHLSFTLPTTFFKLLPLIQNAIKHVLEHKLKLFMSCIFSSIHTPPLPLPP